MNSIILYLLTIIQYQYKQICWLLNSFAKYIPLKQWAFDDSHSPKYQKFKTDKLTVILKNQKQDWDFLLQYYQWRYDESLKPVQHRNGKSIPEDVKCPVFNAPHHYVYDNYGGKGQYICKVCGASFSIGKQLTTPIRFKCLTVLIPCLQRRIVSNNAIPSTTFCKVVIISFNSL